MSWKVKAYQLKQSRPKQLLNLPLALDGEACSATPKSPFVFGIPHNLVIGSDHGVKSEIARQGMNPHVPPSFAIAAATTVISNAQLGGSSPRPRSSFE